MAVHIHGGCWVSGDRFCYDRIEPLLKAGISVASIGYRLVGECTAEGINPPVDGTLRDAARAIQFLRSKASEWNLRKDRVGVWGPSAGGCSSLWLAFHRDLADPHSADLVVRESTRIQCAAVYGAQTSLAPTQLREWIPNIGYGGHAFGFPIPNFQEFLVENRASLLPWIAEYSPFALADASAPPVRLAYGSAPDLGKEVKDPVHSANFGVKLHERLKQLGVDAEVVYPGGPQPRHETPFAFLIEKLNAPSGTRAGCPFSHAAKIPCPSAARHALRARLPSALFRKEICPRFACPWDNGRIPPPPYPGSSMKRPSWEAFPSEKLRCFPLATPPPCSPSPASRHRALV